MKYSRRSLNLWARNLPFLGIFLISGCKSLTCPGFNSSESTQSAQLQGVINVSIDGSGSMKGFSTVNDSAFIKSLEVLDTVLGIKSSLGFTTSLTTVKRIGKESEPSNKVSIVSGLSLLAAKRPEFFDEKKGYWPKVSSTLEQFVSKDLTSVDILISDLEPDNASIKQLISAIKPKLEFEGKTRGWTPWAKPSYPGNELALIGIRSQFSGGVFPSVKGDFSSFPYTGIRPFYILALGPVDKVEKIVSKLVNDKFINTVLQVTRFSSNPNNGATEFINLSNTKIIPASCLDPVFSLSQGLSGKLGVENPNRWLLAQKQRGCTTQLSEIKFGANPIKGYGAGIINDSSYFKSDNSTVTAVKLSSNTTSVSSRFTSFNGVINVLNISADAEKMDQEKWHGWNTSGTLLEGNKTQRLLALIQSIRSETDQFSLQNYNIRYSPVRICSAVKG